MLRNGMIGIVSLPEGLHLANITMTRLGHFWHFDGY